MAQNIVYRGLKFISIHSSTHQAQYKVLAMHQ